jgi:hypothetical protein
MGFSQEQGYTPATINSILLAVMNGINEQFGTTYTWETFVGTNFYKFFYVLAQRVQENEIKASEIFLKLQDYFATTNEVISRPVVTNPGLVAALEAQNYIASVKPMINADAGKISVCVDIDDQADGYAAKKLEICTIISQSTVAGGVTQGTQSESIVLSNGQAFDFKYCLPNRIDTYLKLTITLSENNQSVILTPDEIKALLLANIAARYRLGRNFEPQRYFSTVDAPWAGSVLLEYSIDEGANWLTAISNADFDDLMEFDLENITLVEA